jgi:hypothetical protein
MLTLNKRGIPIWAITIFNILIIFLRFQNNINLLIFSDSSITVSRTLWGKEKKIVFNYRSLEYSFKDALVGRDIVAKSLMLQSGGKKVAMLSPSISGFSKDEIQEMATILAGKLVKEIN